jgi:hypothetical protein
LKPSFQRDPADPREQGGTGTHRLARIVAVAAVSLAALLPALALTSAGCGDENEACAWLLAPPSFVDAGQPGCTAQPAGQSCDSSTGRCQDICQPNEYLLTCRSSPVSGPAMPVEALFDPVIVSRDRIKCNPVELPGQLSRNETNFCCQCAH